MGNNKLTYMAKVTLAGLICLSATPTHAMMGRLRSTVARATQQVRQAGAAYRNSLFNKPATGTPQPLIQTAAPSNMQLPTIAPATQQKINPKLLAPCIAAAGVVVAVSTAVDSTESDAAQLKKELAALPRFEGHGTEGDLALELYLDKKITSTAFPLLYNVVSDYADTFPVEVKNAIRTMIFKVLFSKEYNFSTLSKNFESICPTASPEERERYLNRLIELVRIHIQATNSDDFFIFIKSLNPQQQITAALQLIKLAFVNYEEYCQLFLTLVPLFSDQDLVQIVNSLVKESRFPAGFSLARALNSVLDLSNASVSSIANAKRIIELVFTAGSLETRLSFLAGIDCDIFFKPQEKLWRQETCNLFIQEIETVGLCKTTIAKIEDLFNLLEHANLSTTLHNLTLTASDNVLVVLLFYRPWMITHKQKEMLFDHHSKEIIHLGNLLCRRHSYASQNIKEWPNRFQYQLATKILQEEQLTTLTPFVTELIKGLSTEQHNQWFSDFYSYLYIPFFKTAEEDHPLLQSNFTPQQLAKPFTRDTTLNFLALMPLIIEHISQEYKEGRIVLFHGQSHRWMLLQTIWQQLQALKKNQSYDSTKIDLRFTDRSSVSNDQVELLRKEGTGAHAHLRAQTLFSNLHIFGNLYNNIGSSTWDYITRNYDQTLNRRAEILEGALKDMFTELDMQEEYAALFSENPNIFKTLEEQFEAAVKEQGNFGNLLVISMPQDVAERLVYSAHPGGHIKPLTFDGKETTSVVDASKNPTELPKDNEWVIILSEEMINPEKREAAGIKIVGFDPVKYWQTSSYLKFEEQVEKELMEPLRNMRAQKASEQGEQS